MPKHYQQSIIFLGLLLLLFTHNAAWADMQTMGSVGEEQIQEKAELQNMKDEMNDIKSTISESAKAMSQIQAQVSQQKQIKEFHLTARESKWELLPGVSCKALLYNGQIPGPTLRVNEGDLVRVVLHNQLQVPTSLYFHGLTLSNTVAGLPRKQAGLVGPGETYTYEFTASNQGTIWYHPQVIHNNQIFAGFSGILIVDPTNSVPAYSKDYVLVLGQWTTTEGQTYFTINGKSAPLIPSIEVKKGQRIRLRILNLARVACPIYLTGHKFEVISCNGSLRQDIDPRRDILTINPGDRYDLDFVADNPGTWYLSSIIPQQATNAGKFPGGMACLIRYIDTSEK